MRPWHWLLAVVALVVPIQAVALDDGAGGSLSASASLGYCGVSETGISCQINVSWSGIEGAERYTASATLADGSVRDLGTVGVGAGGGSTSVWVPYVGDGSYGVTITAWGSEDGEERKLDEGEMKLDSEPELGDGIDRETAPKPESEPEEGEPAPGEEQPPAEPTPAPEPEPGPVPEPSPEPEPVPEPEPEPAPELPAPAPAPEPVPEEGAGTTTPSPTALG